MVSEVPNTRNKPFRTIHLQNFAFPLMINDADFGDKTEVWETKSLDAD